MVEMMMKKKETSHWWWFDSHQTSSGSPWLQSTLAELDKKTKAMLELIEANADSFAQRAEMYYEKRPELISMVEDFYRTHRSLAERYNQLKSDSGNRLLTTLGSPFSNNYLAGKSMSVVTDQNYDTQSETCDPEDAAESEIEDPEEHQIQVDEEMEEIENPGQKKETQVDEEAREVEVSSAMCNIEMKKLKEEIQRLKQENMIYKEHLLRKDEEKREQMKETQLNEGLREVEVSKIVCNIEVMELKEEIERLKQENLIYKGCLLQKNEAKRGSKKGTQLNKRTRDVEVSRVVCNIEAMELKEEIEELKEENMIYKDRLWQKDEEAGEQKKETRVNEITSDVQVSGVVRNIEAMELKEEIEKLKEENMIYKDRLLQKDEEMREQKKETRAIERTRDVEVSSALFNDEVKKLREEIARLKEGNRVYEDLLLQKDEEKREVIRQLSLAVEVIKLENMKLRKCVARESPKKRRHTTVEKMKDVIMAKFSNGGSSKSQGSAVAL